MSRHESDREDLFSELAALSPRVELRLTGSGETVCAGRRESTGGWSVYLTPDRVYHFDSEGRLRRAFVDGFLYRSAGRVLSRLRRERSETETALMRSDLDPAELTGFLSEMRLRIADLAGSIGQNQVEVLRVSANAVSVTSQLMETLDVVCRAEPALSPAIRG